MQASDGKLYGTTYSYYDGVATGGVIYSYDPASGVTATVYHFADSSSLVAGLVQGIDGKLYGAAIRGPNGYAGYIFSFDIAAGSVAILHQFTGGASDGATPLNGLVLSSDRKRIYGTTAGGGPDNCGTVFEWDIESSAYTLLHTFQATPGAGFDPTGLLVVNDNGVDTLYGTTYAEPNNGVTGGVYSLNPATHQFVPLKRFAALYGTPAFPGYGPWGPLVQSSTHPELLYGTTTDPNSWGTFFSIDRFTGDVSVVYVFADSNRADRLSPAGGDPYGPLLEGSDGRLYGMTRVCQSGPETVCDGHTYGALFAVDPATRVLTVIHSFTGAPDDGNNQEDTNDIKLLNLVRGADGDIYGATEYGGASNQGALFKLTLSHLTVTPGADQTLTASPIGQGAAALSAVASGGTAPYSYQWTLASGVGDVDDIPAIVGTAANVNISLPLGAFTFKVTATDAAGATASSTMQVTVQIPTGLAGPQGLQGEQGLQGIQGVKGDKGDKGDLGDQGGKGDQGIQGIQGMQGIQGLKGDKGDKGDQGVQGPKGDKGDRGDQGIQGSPGTPGLAGAMGPAGPPGPQGPANSQLWNALLDLTTVGKGSTFTPDGNLTVTRVQIQLQTVPAGCNGAATVKITDGTSGGTRTFAVNSATIDSGPLSMNFTAGVPIGLGVSAAAAGCKTSPANANVLVQYKGR
jgi:uncharacterized repeat protein (TIGR03803 family)